jgi:glycosyltransferase involved in cell wall biosynthesis
MKISAIILTKNEEKHIKRCIESIYDLVDEIIIMDSFSNDATKSIVQTFDKVDFYQNKWVNYSTQYAFAETKCTNDWVLRLDADEYLLNMDLSKLSTSNASGFRLKRKIVFMGKELSYGGLGNIYQLRLYNRNLCSIEKRWMDEHIVCSGLVESLDCIIYDDNHNDLDWWSKKHLSYAQREVIDIQKSTTDSRIRGGEAFKRYIKNNVYSKLGIYKTFLYFLYRYVFLLGFLDGRRGLIFHFLQGCWYRFYVEALIYENKRK